MSGRLTYQTPGKPMSPQFEMGATTIGGKYVWVGWARGIDGPFAASPRLGQVIQAMRLIAGLRVNYGDPYRIDGWATQT